MISITSYHMHLYLVISRKDFSGVICLQVCVFALLPWSAYSVVLFDSPIDEFTSLSEKLILVLLIHLLDYECNPFLGQVERIIVIYLAGLWV